MFEYAQSCSSIFANKEPVLYPMTFHDGGCRNRAVSSPKKAHQIEPVEPRRCLDPPRARAVAALLGGPAPPSAPHGWALHVRVWRVSCKSHEMQALDGLFGTPVRRETMRR